MRSSVPVLVLRVAVALAAATWVPTALSGQQPSPTGPRRAWASPPVQWPDPGAAGVGMPIALATTDPGVVATASLILPGTGQLLLGKKRWLAYAAVEAIGWIVHLDRRREGRRQRNAYRDVAWLTARATSPEPRIDGDWRYYERLERWTRSGGWDSDPERPGIQPEPDPNTFNGSVWSLARDLFLPVGGEADPDAQAQALDYYRAHAYPPEMLWDWTGHEESLARFRDFIDRSDAALRTATIVLGAVVANHLFSAVDAFVAARLGERTPLSSAAVLRAGPAGPLVEWRLDFRR